MEAYLKLKSWREQMGFSTYDLAEKLEEKMSPDFPKGFKRGEKIFQSDVVLAEKGQSRKRFEKVVNAIYKYMDVEPGHFGKFVPAPKSDEPLSEEGTNDEYRKQTLELHRRLLEAHESINRLNMEKIELLQRNFDLQTENIDLKRRLETFERK